MSFDGLFMHHIIHEISPLIIGGRIDKVFQPERDELSLGIRGLNQNYHLFISADASMPYFTLISEKKENPQEPPMFCMLLRKHLTGGKILSMKQVGFERVVVIEIESKNDFGDLESKKLMIEIMGKHSNIILTKENDIIIDSIKRITPDMSRVRTLLPGLKYEFLPTDKIDFNLSSAQVVSELLSRATEQSLFKGLYGNIQGFSPLISSWICRELQISKDALISELQPNQQLHLETLFDKIKRTTTLGTIYMDAQNHPQIAYFLETLDQTLEQKSYSSLIKMIEEFYTKSNKDLKMHQRTTALKKNLSQRIERYTSKLKKQELELIDAENADESRKIGELITANNYLIEKGMNRVEVLDYYVDPPVMREILLDTRLEPIENAQVHFRKYNKLKKAVSELQLHIVETKADILYLENVLTYLNNSEDTKIIDEIREELVIQGYIKGKLKKKTAKQSKPTFKQFLSSDGYEILVGKSSLQNDQLTTKIASNKDIWLHTKDIPGSHVIIRTKGEVPSETALYEAAMIAAYYSKAKDSSNVPVDYTHVKNVSKPSGAKPGMVIYVQQKTLYVTPDYAFIQQLEKN